MRPLHCLVFSVLLAAFLAACSPKPIAQAPDQPRNVQAEEIGKALCWDIFRQGDRYWLTTLTAVAWECSDCNFTEDGRLKACRECRPRPFEDAYEAKRGIQPEESNLFEIWPDVKVLKELRKRASFTLP